MNKLKIAQYIALGATICSVIGVVSGGMSGDGIGAGLLGVGMLGGLVAYVLGGFRISVKMAKTIAKWGWFILPFPFELVSVALSFLFAIVIFLYKTVLRKCRYKFEISKKEKEKRVRIPLKRNAHPISFFKKFETLSNYTAIIC